MKKYVLSTGAEQDLIQIWDYIASDDIDSADHWIGKLFLAFERIARNPGIGHRREDLTQLPVLFWPVGAYLIIYRVLNGQVEIVAVTQGSRDIPIFVHRRMS